MTDVPPDVAAVRALAVWGWERETLVIEGLDQQLADAAYRRDEHVRSLHESGLSHRDIAPLLHVSQARIGQIMARINARLPREKKQT